MINSSELFIYIFFNRYIFLLTNFDVFRFDKDDLKIAIKNIATDLQSEFQLFSYTFSLLQICCASNSDNNTYTDIITFESIPEDDDIVYIRNEPQYHYGRKTITEYI